MTNFVYDNVALPANKVDSAGGSDPVSNPTRRWVPNDVNRVFTAIDDMRDIMRGNFVSVRSFGATGDGVTDDYQAFQDAIDHVAATVSGTVGGFVLVPKGLFILGTGLVLPNGVGLRGSGPASTILRAKSGVTFTSLIRNQNLDGTQEFGFLEGMEVQGNRGGGAVCSDGVVTFGSLFVNSYMRDVTILNGSHVGLHVVASGSPGGSGPVLFENIWVRGCAGHNILVEEDGTNAGAVKGLCFVNLISEHQLDNKSAIYLKGLGSCLQWNFFNTHIEMGNGHTGRTGITIDGVAHCGFYGVQLQTGDPAGITEGINILNVVQNVGLQFRGITNINLINPVIRDQKNSLTIGAINVHNYCTADVQNHGAPKYSPVTGGKSIVFQSSAFTDRAWFDDTGQLTGQSANGAGLDIVGDVTNDRPLTLSNNAKARVYGWYFSGNNLRKRYFTGGVDVWQIATDGTVFHYESPTFQKTATFQQGLRLSAEISPAQITANQNNYSPSGLSTAVTMLLTSDASRDITGIAAQSSGAVLWVYNIGAQNIVLKHQDANSTAANRIIGTAGADVTLTPNRCVMLRYSAAQTRWLVMTDNL